MRYRRWFTCLLACALLLAPLADARAEPLENDVRDTTQVTQLQAQGLCFERSVRFGGITVDVGCYEPYLARTAVGGYLALAARPMTSGQLVVAPGQTVLPDTLGAIRQLRNLVPLPVPLTTIPMNALHSVTVRIDGPAGRIIVPVPGIGPIAIEFAYR